MGVLKFTIKELFLDRNYLNLRRFVFRLSSISAIVLLFQLFFSLYDIGYVFQPWFSPIYTTSVISSCFLALSVFFILGHEKVNDAALSKLRTVRVVLGLTVLLFLLSAYLALKLFLSSEPSHPGFLMFRYLILLLSAIVLWFTFFSFPDTTDLISRSGKEIVLSFFVGLSYYSLSWLVQSYSSTFSGLNAFLVAELFKSLGIDVVLVTSGYPLLVFNGVAVGIAEPCSGVDSLLMFTALFGGAWISTRSCLDIKMMSLCFFMGTLSVLLLNMIRIVLILLLAQISKTFALGLFHSSISLVLFSLFFVLYWRITCMLAGKTI